MCSEPRYGGPIPETCSVKAYSCPSEGGGVRTAVVDVAAAVDDVAAAAVDDVAASAVDDVAAAVDDVAAAVDDVAASAVEDAVADAAYSKLLLS